MSIDHQAGVFGGGLKYISRSALASVELSFLVPPFSEKNAGFGGFLPGNLAFWVKMVLSGPIEAFRGSIGISSSPPHGHMEELKLRRVGFFWPHSRLREKNNRTRVSRHSPKI